MTRLGFIPLVVLMALGACAPQPTFEFIPSKKSAVELRAVQTRLVPGDDNTVMRGVIATLHRLGYRVTRAETEAGTVSGTRQTLLRMAVVVQPGKAGQSIVRANATVIAILREAQVDSAEFYQKAFFGPLAETVGRQSLETAIGDDVPDAVRPVAEVNTANDRKAAADKANQPAKPPERSTTP